LKAALVLSILLLASIASAQDTSPVVTGLFHNRDYLSLQPFEFIDTSNSNVALRFDDLTLPGNAGHPLTFQRVYSNGWRFTINGLPMDIIEKTFPLGNIGDDLASNYQWAPYLNMPDGSQRPMVFVQSPSTNIDWVQTADFWKYQRTAGQLHLPDGTVAQYVKRYPNDLSDLHYRLSSITDLFGNTTTLTWSVVDLEVAPPHFDPTSLAVTQTLGNSQTRTILVSLNQATQLPTELTYASRTWSYEYDPADSGVLKHVYLPHSAGDDAIQWTFDYGTTPTDAGRVTRIATPHGGEITYTYGEETFPDGMGGSTQMSVLRTRSVGGRNVTAGTWTFSYTLGLSGFIQNVSVVTPSATTIAYTYQSAGDGAVSGVWAVSTRSVRSADGALVESEERQYRRIPIVSHGSPQAFDSVELASNIITRYAGGGSHTYRTDLTYNVALFGDYHHPIQVRETGDDVNARVTFLSYSHAPALGRITSVTTAEGSASVSNYFASYDVTTGFLNGDYRFNIHTTYTADAFGNVATSTNANSKTTNYTYEWGVLKNIATPEYLIGRAINEDGTTQSETRGGRTVTLAYDALGRLRQNAAVVSSPDTSDPTTIAYHDAPEGGGPATVVTSRGASSLTQTLDGFGRALSTINAVGVRTRTDYDAEGRVGYQSYPFTTSGDVACVSEGASILVPCVHFEYDALGQLTRRTNPDQTYRQLTYGFGSVVPGGPVVGKVTIVDEAGRTTEELRTAFGDPGDTRLISLLDADNKRWSYTYTPTGRLTTVTTPDGLQRKWLYNANNLLLQDIQPEGRTSGTSYTYDPAGFVSQTNSPRATFTYTRDGNGRTSNVSVSGRTTTITYEAGTDNVATMSVGNVSTQFGYDSAGRLTSRIDSVGSQVFRTGYEYDGVDNLVTIKYPSLSTTPRRQIGLDYDDEHRLKRVFDRVAGTNYASQFAFHPSGALTGYQAGNFVTTSIGYDPDRYWTRSVSAAGGPHNIGWQLNYDNYDPVGNVRSLTDSRPNKSQAFAYDSLDRLTTADGPYGSAVYAYDAHGNRTTIPGGTTYDYYPGKLQLKAVDGAIMTYSPAGDLLSAPNETYAYTPQGMLETLGVYNTTTTYSYDAEDARIMKVVGANATYYLRGLTGELLTEWQNPGGSNEIRDYIYAGGRLIAAIGRPVTGPADINIYKTASIDGPATSFTFTNMAQKAYVTFQGTLGQRLTPVITVGGGGCIRFTVKQPDSGLVWSAKNTCSTTYWEPATLTMSGPYTVVVEPIATPLGTVTLTLADVQDVTTTISADGTPVSVAITKVGQNATLTFTGAATQRVSALATSNAGECLSWPIAVQKADGTTLQSAYGCGAVFVEPTSLPTNTSYQVYMDPNVMTTGSGTVKLYSVVDTSGTATINGGTVAVSIPTPGQVHRLTFSGVGGQQVTVRLTSNTMSTTSVKLLRPDQTQLTSSQSSAASFNLPSVTLPTDGSYTIVVDPNAQNNGSIDVAVTNP